MTTELLEQPMEAVAEPAHPNRELIDGLRAMADWLEDHPQDPNGSVTLNLFPNDRDALLKAIQGVGRVEKQAIDKWYYLRKRFSSHVTIEWNQSRESVCERVVVGTKTIAAEPEKIIPAKPERVEEVVEWRCPESILRSE